MPSSSPIRRRSSKMPRLPEVPMWTNCNRKLKMKKRNKRDLISQKLLDFWQKVLDKSPYKLNTTGLRSSWMRFYHLSMRQIKRQQSLIEISSFRQRWLKGLIHFWKMGRCLRAKQTFSSKSKMTKTSTSTSGKQRNSEVVSSWSEKS
jgi:hypothetical protein